MIKMNKNLITRKKYNEVKKYDRQQMDEFLNSIYIYGYREAINYIHKEINNDEFPNTLKKIKGFGNARALKIIDIMNQIIDELIKTINM